MKNNANPLSNNGAYQHDQKQLITPKVNYLGNTSEQN